MATEKVEVSVSIAAGISAHKKFNGGIAIKLSKQGKTWTIARSEEEFTNLHRTLEKEFAGVLSVPSLPALSSPNDSLDSLQGYLAALINHPTIKTSGSLIKFVELQQEKKVATKTSKRGLLTLQNGKARKFEVVVENRVLYCKGESSGAVEIAVLLDNCDVDVDPFETCGFTVSISKETGKEKRRTKLGKKSNSGYSFSYTFIANSPEERDEWVEVIRTVSQIYKEASFTVSGRLTVEVVEGRKLAPKDFNFLRANTSDPYVVLRIECQQAKSRTIDRNLNPVWNEEFSFDITQNQGILFVLIYDEDIMRSDSMGQVVIPLSGIPPGTLHDTWLPVLPRKAQEKVSGEIHLRLKYDYVKEEKPAVMGPIFGMNLQEICDNPHLCADGVPKFFSSFLAHLEAKAISEQGIFRISGSFSAIKELKQKVDEGKEIDLDNYDVNTIAGVLKLYLRELPIPILTYENYGKLIEISTISNEKELLQQLKMILVVIPPAHVDLLKKLLPSLKHFSENSKVNMMTTSNLAIVFGPSLIRPQVDNFDTVLHTVNISTLTSILIEHNISLFQ